MKPKSYMYWMKNDILCRYLRTGWWGRLSCLQIQMFCRIVSNRKSSYENERVSCCVLSNSNNYNIYYNTGMKFVDANRKLSSIWLSVILFSYHLHCSHIFSDSHTPFTYPFFLSCLTQQLKSQYAWWWLFPPIFNNYCNISCWLCPSWKLIFRNHEIPIAI